MEDWPAGEWETLAERAAAAAAEGESVLANARLIASLLFPSDAEVHTLNREWRERDKPTNVLSFPMLQRARDGGEGRQPCRARRTPNGPFCNWRSAPSA